MQFDVLLKAWKESEKEICNDGIISSEGGVVILFKFLMKICSKFTIEKLVIR